MSTSLAAAAPPTHGHRPGRPSALVPAAVFTAGLAAAAAVMSSRSATVRLRWLAWASTDLDNLRDHPVTSMIASAFLTTGSITPWLVLAFVGLAAAGSALGPLRAAVLAATAQVIGTVAGEGLLGARIHAGAVDPAAREQLDVGPSYVVVGALVAGIFTARGPWRLACALGFGLLVPHLFGGLPVLDVTAVGHSVAVVTGAGLGVLLARSARGPAPPGLGESTPEAGPGRRAQYAYDGSNYRVAPQAVAFPRDADEVAALVRAANADGRPVTARGGGTGIAGNSVGPGLVIDFSRAMNQVLELDPVRRLAVVQPGLVLDDLREAAAPHRLSFGPDPSSHSRCTLGGMIGNDACGNHSVRHGRTVDHVLALDLVLADGTRAVAERGGLRAADPADPGAVARVAALEQRLRRLAEANLAVLRTELGRIPRQVSGYQLHHLLPERGFDVARALVGSEGGCALVVAATVRLVPVPFATRLVVLGYRDIVEAAEDVPRVLGHEPGALEGLDAAIVATMRQRRGPGAVPDLPAGAAWLFVELDADGDAADATLTARAEALLSDVASAGRMIEGRAVPDPGEVAALWRVREDGAGLTTRPGGDPPAPMAFPGWEDAAVAPDRLAGYLREFLPLVARHGLSGALFGHFGAGCVHVRIDFDPSTAAGATVMRAFLTEAARLVVAHGGTLSGEHGDGRARGELLPLMYSPAVLSAFAAFKAAWDPENRLNPGIVVHPPALDADLALAGSGVHRVIASAFRYAEEPAGFAGAVHNCVGIARCRSRADDVAMCPSYRVTGDERDSTRGRARMLQEMLRGGGLLTGGWRSPEVLDALDLCLSCKACAVDCPVGVDMATYKSEFLHHHYRGRLRPRTHYTLGWLPAWAAIGGRAPAAANAVLGSPTLSRAAARLGGLTGQRDLPRLHHRGLAAREARRVAAANTVRRPAGEAGSGVVLLVDTFTAAFRPGLAVAAARVLADTGLPVRIQDGACCAITWISTGQLSRARRVLRRSVAALDAGADGDALVVLEPSCAATLRTDAPALLATPAAARVARRVTTFAGIIDGALDRGWTPPPLPPGALLQTHCHEYATFADAPQGPLLARLGVRATHTDGCCGLAGNFGVEREHYATSLAVAGLSLRPHLAARDPDQPVLADGFSCRLQVEHLDRDARPEHLAELLDRHLRIAD